MYLSIFFPPFFLFRRGGCNFFLFTSWKTFLRFSFTAYNRDVTDRENRLVAWERKSEASVENSKRDNLFFSAPPWQKIAPPHLFWWRLTSLSFYCLKEICSSILQNFRQHRLSYFGGNLCKYVYYAWACLMRKNTT